MTAAEARDSVVKIRGELDRAVRALSVPVTDWAGAEDALGWAATLAMELARDCRFERERRGHGE